MARFYSQVESSLPTSSSAQLLSFLPCFYRLPSFMPPRSSWPLLPLPHKSYTIHFPSLGAFIHPDVSPNVRTQRAQALGVQTPNAHASSLSRTAQNQTVRPSFPNACKARTIPREMTPVERREQESGEHVTGQMHSVYCSMVER